MTDSMLESLGPARLRLSGKLNLSTVNNVQKQVKGWLDREDARQLLIDLSGVDYCDSSGVALLLVWVRYARKQQKDINYANLPEQLLAIAKISGLEGIMPISAISAPPSQSG